MKPVPGGVRRRRLRRADPLPLLQRSRPGRPARRRRRALARRSGSGMADDLPILLFASKRELEAWLEENHAGAEGLWLKIAKKGVGVESVNYAEALELALCFGWIDGQKRGLDDAFFLQRFTPRRPRGKWSQINRAKAEELIAAGAMRPAGPGRGGGGEGGRSLGRRLRGPARGDGAGRPAARARSQQGRGASSSPRSTAPTATRSSTGYRRRRSPRRAKQAAEVHRDAGARREDPRLAKGRAGAFQADAERSK